MNPQEPFLRKRHRSVLQPGVKVTSTRKKRVSTPRLDRSLQRDVTTQRFLRIEEGGEERGIATTIEKTKSLFTSSKVSQKTLERWVKNKKSPAQVLTRLQLDDARLMLFQNPKFKTWFTYMMMLNKQSPETAMVSFLTARYSDDLLSQMIITAKKAPGTKDMATQLQAGQMSLWKSNGRSADDAFSLFGLTRAKGSIFDHSEFTSWVKYVDDLYESDPKKAISMITSTLTSRYSDEAIMTMAAAAKKVPATESTATRLEAVMTQRWLSKDTSPADAFRLFGLQADDALLSNPALNSWVKYLDDFNTKNPNEKTTMLKTFTSYYGDEELYKMLKAAKDVGTTKKVATDLQTAQLANWLATKQNPRDVNRWMGVKGSKPDSVERVAFRKYLNDYNAKYVQPK